MTNDNAHTGGLNNKPAKCECDGFEDRVSYENGHYTVVVHENDCPMNPENWEFPERDDAENTPNCVGCQNGCQYCESDG